MYRRRICRKREQGQGWCCERWRLKKIRKNEENIGNEETKQIKILEQDSKTRFKMQLQSFLETIQIFTKVGRVEGSLTVQMCWTVVA